MPTRSSFFSEDFIHRYKEVFPITDHPYRIRIHEMLDSGATPTSRQISTMIEYTEPGSPQRSINVAQILEALDDGGDKLLALRAEAEACMKRIAWCDRAEALAHELSRMSHDPRIVEI